MIRPKVMVACSTYKGSKKYLEQYLEGIKSQTYTNWELVFCDNSDSDEFAEELKSFGYVVLRSPSNQNIHLALVTSYNTLREYFLENQFDLMWIVESDQIPPPEALERLVTADKPVIGLPYLLNKANDTICVHNPITEQIFNWREFELYANKKPIVKVWGCGHGAVLAKREVLDKIPFRLDNYERPGASPDTWWYVDLKKERIPVYCLSDCFSEHLRITDYSPAPEGELVFKIKSPTFVRYAGQGDFFNSGPAWDKFFLMKGQIKKLPNVVGEITWNAIQNGTLKVLDPIKEKADIEQYEKMLKEQKLNYKRK